MLIHSFPSLNRFAQPLILAGTQFGQPVYAKYTLLGKQPQNLTIGRIARDAGTGVETIRFYERQCLLAKPARTTSGYRSYAPEVVRRLRFIRHAKELGFSLREIKDLLSLRVAPGKSCGDVKSRATQKIAEVDRKMASLIRIRRALVKLSVACSGKGPVTACPILDALETQEVTE